MTKSPAPQPPAYAAASPATIQPHGVLVALDADLRAVVLSANVKGLLGVAAEDAVGRPLADLVGPTLAAIVAERVTADLAGEPLELVLDELAEGAELAGLPVDVHHHRSGDRLVVEIEPVSSAASVRITYASTRGAMVRLTETRTVGELATRLAVEVRSLLGFDRVLVHRFDDQGTGEQLADQPGDGATPAPAYRLATVDGAHLVADVGHPPVPLHPVVDPGTDGALDLSGASLRSVDPLDLESLADSGVRAAMSVPLVVHGRLWGVVSCHHHSGPYRPGHDARAAAEFLVQAAAQLVADRERADARERALLAQSVLARITARIAASADNPLDTTMADPELLSLVNASGAALCYDGVVWTRGSVPDEDLLPRIARALEDHEHYATHTDRIAGLLPELEGSPDVVGVLRIGSAHDRWLLWFRPEHGPAGAGRSLPWAPWKVEIADALGKYLTGTLLSRSREQIAMAESVQRSVVIDQPPVVPGVRLAARYRPASSYQLGGDWWDAFELDDGSLAFVVGDVAGHGVSAASAMIQVRTALRAYLVEGHCPAACLDRLDHLMASLLDQRVATAVVGLVDPTRRQVTIASAGHLPPILVRDGEAEDVGIVVRPLLGVGAGTAVSTVLTPAPGSTLLLYTDGLVERRGLDLAARTTRLRELAAETHGPGDLDAWLETLLARHQAEEVGGGGTDDDTTVLAVRFAPEAG